MISGEKYASYKFFLMSSSDQESTVLHPLKEKKRALNL